MKGELSAAGKVSVEKIEKIDGAVKVTGAAKKAERTAEVEKKTGVAVSNFEAASGSGFITETANAGTKIEVVFKSSGKINSSSPKGLIGHAFEDYLTRNIGGNGSFSTGGRDFDGGIGKRWWEAKSGKYWDMLETNPTMLAKFKSDMGDRLKIAMDNSATYELFSNTPIPASVKQWLSKKGIAYTELLD